MKRLFLLLLVMLSLAETRAQDQHLIDSLQLQLKNHHAHKLELQIKSPSQYDTTAADIIYALSKAYWGSNSDKAMDYANQCLALSEQIGYKKGIGNAYNSKGIINSYKGDYLPTLELYKKSLKIREEIGDRKGIAASYNNIGEVNRLQGNYPEALKNHFASLKIVEELRDKQGMARSYNNLGLIYDRQGNYPEALKNHFSSLKINEENGDKNGVASSYFNIGIIYNEEGNDPEALKNYFVALKIYEEIGNKYGIANFYNNIGLIYDRQGNYSEALKNYLASLKIREDIGDKEGIVTTYVNIGVICTKKKKHNDASQYLNKALSLSKEIGSLDRIKASYNYLATLDSAQGNFKQALEHYKMFITTRDSIFNQENAKKLVQSQMQYDFDKKESLTKAEQEKKDRLAREQIIFQRNIRNSSFAGFAVVLLFSLVFYRQRNKIGREKKRSDQLVLDKEMLIKEIHHRVKNNLEVISSLLELQSEGIDDAKAKAAVMEGQNRVQSIALIHHKLYRTDDVSAVEFKGFVGDLYKQVSGVFKKPGDEIEFEITANETPISIDAAVPIGLILNELMTNSFKYAVAKEKQNTISIQLTSTGEKGFNKIIYCDNGPGLPSGFDIQKSSSLGMKVIQLLTRQMGGALNYYNDNGSVFEIPFKMV